MTILRLPWEIVEEILERLQRENLEDCKYVCKKWNQVASNLLCKTIVVNDYLKGYEYFNKLFQALESSPEKSLKDVCIDSYGRKLLPRVFELCPNITKIYNSKET